MALKGILGYDGVTPVLTPDGTQPVLMESPCPYAQWEILGDPITDLNAAVTHGDFGGSTFWIRADEVVKNQLVYQIRLRMISAGANKSVRATLSYGGGDAGTAFYGALQPFVPDMPSLPVYPMDNNVDFTTTTDMPEPYYRYLMIVTLYISETELTGPLAWARLDFEFV